MKINNDGDGHFHDPPTYPIHYALGLKSPEVTSSAAAKCVAITHWLEIGWQ